MKYQLPTTTPLLIKTKAANTKTGTIIGQVTSNRYGALCISFNKKSDNFFMDISGPSL